MSNVLDHETGLWLLNQSRSQNLLFDLKKTQEDKPYLVITESRFKGEGQDRERAKIAVFPEQVKEFLAATQEMVGK